MIISKVRALVLVLLSFCMAVTFVMTSPGTSRALLPLAIPVAKVAGGLVLSYALEQGVTTALDKSSLPDDSPVKKFGKWGAKLTGSRASLALGLLGGSIALATEFDWGDSEAPENAEDGDGYRMPRDFQEDLMKDPAAEPISGTVSMWEIKEVVWDAKYTSSGHYRPRYIVECISSNETGSYTCPVNEFPHERPNGLSERLYCRDGSSQTVAFEVNNPNTSIAHSLPPCRGSRGGISHTRVYSGGGIWVGLANPGTFYNPHPEGHEQEITVTATTECVDGAGNNQLVSKTVPGGDVIPIAKCPTGWVPVETQWERNNTRSGANEWLGGVQQSPSEEFPECGPGECTRVIKVDNEVCDATRPECADWLKTTAPDRVRCEYGPYALGLEECADMEHLHKTTWGIVPNPDPTGVPAWLPANPDGTPDYTRVDQDWAPDEVKNPWYTPVTPGRWSTGSPSTNPSSTPTTVPGTPLEPGTGTEPGTGSETGTGFPSSGTNPQNDSENCLAGMWSWNPVDWVYIPVKCALQWAFVPKPGQASQLMTNFKTQYGATGLGTWSAVPASIVSEFPTGEAGCKGPAMTVPAALGGKTYYPLDACEDPMAQYAQMSKALISLLVVVFGGFSMANTISVAATGYPIFRREQQVSV